MFNDHCLVDLIVLDGNCTQNQVVFLGQLYGNLRCSSLLARAFQNKEDR